MEFVPSFVVDGFGALTGVAEPDVRESGVVELVDNDRVGCARYRGPRSTGSSNSGDSFGQQPQSEHDLLLSDEKVTKLLYLQHEVISFFSLRLAYII